MGHKEVRVTHLRKLMLDELQRRNYAQNTVRAYVRAVESCPMQDEPEAGGDSNTR